MKMHNKTIIISSYDEPRNPYYGGGGAIAVHEVAKRLQKFYTIIVLCGKYPGAKDYIKDNLTYTHIGLSFAGGKIGQLIYQCMLPWYVLTKQYDLWIESFTPPFSTACLPLFTKKPVVALVHMLSGEDMKRKYHLPFDLLENIGVRAYKYFIVLTEENKKKILKINTYADIQIIANGVDIPHTRTTSSTKRKHILYIGRIEVDQKGLDLLLKSYQTVAHKIKVPLVIAGNGAETEMKKLQSLIQQFSLESSVKLVGKITDTAKEVAYRDAFCVVISSRFETFSMVALETFARGRALVTFAIPGLRWIPNTIRVVIEEWNTKKLGNALYLLVTQDTKRTVLETKGKAFAKNYDWNTVAAEYHKYITAIMEEVL